MSPPARGAAPASRGRLAAWIFALVLLVASVAYVAATFQWHAALGILSRLDAAWFFAGCGSAVLVYWALRALRWRVLLGTRTRAPFADLYLSSAVALSLSVFTPLQSGEALKVELLRQQGHVERLPGYATFAIERAADLYVIVAIGIVSLAGASTLALAFAVVALAALPPAALAVLQRMRPRGRLASLVGHLQEGVPDRRALSWLLVLTVAGWLAVACGWYAALRSIAIDLDVRQTLALLSIVSLATIASLVPGGLGIAEAGTAHLLQRFGVDSALAQAGALALRAFSLLVIALGAAHLAWLRLRAPSRPRATR